MVQLSYFKTIAARNRKSRYVSTGFYCISILLCLFSFSERLFGIRMGQRTEDLQTSQLPLRS